MEWSDLVAASSQRPGMYVNRPYVDGLMALWLGHSLGARDDVFDRFCVWVQTERFPAPGGYQNPVAVQGILRTVVAGKAGAFTQDDDDKAVGLLRQLVDEFHAAEVARTRSGGAAT